MTSAEIIKDSVNPIGDRVTTYLVTFPRYLLAEFNTHRMLSRNAASSRAIPAKKMLEMIRTNPVIPAYWGANQAGMQSQSLLTKENQDAAEHQWLAMRDEMLSGVESLEAIGLHKQWTNRPLETWMHVTVLATGTDWHNFFALRAHEAAHPDFMQLAFRMLNVYLKSKPNRLHWGDWHLPFEENMPAGLDEATKLKVAVARAARLSYLTFEGEINVDKDMELHDRLLINSPKHASPGEHQAKAEKEITLEVPDPLLPGEKKIVSSGYSISGYHQGNLTGWTQYRKMLAGENVKQAPLTQIMARKPEWISL